MFVKGYWFLSFAENMDKKSEKKFIKTRRVKAAKNLFIIFDFFTKNSTTIANKTNSKTAEGTGDVIGSKIRYKISKFSKITKQNNFENETEIPKEKYIHTDERQQIIDKLNIII